MITNENRYTGGNKHGTSCKGKLEFLKVRCNEKYSRKDAILAYCYDCMGFYEDGKMDCLNEKCPLYPWMPYKGKAPT